MTKKEIEDFVKKINIDEINFDIDDFRGRYYKNPKKSQILNYYIATIKSKIKEYNDAIKVFESKLNDLMNLSESYTKIETFEKNSKKK